MVLAPKCRNPGVTLFELIVALPMLALVGLAISFALASSSRATGTQIARVKCQVAASNLLTLIKAASDTPSLDTVAAHLQAGQLSKTSVAHPDGGIRLNVQADILPNGDGTHGTIEDMFRIRVTAPDFFDIGSEIKTYFGY